MRTIAFIVALSAFAAPKLAVAQYDFDDFLKAVESGHSKSTPPSLMMPRLAQAPRSLEQSGMLESAAPQPVPLRQPNKAELLPVPGPSQTAPATSQTEPVPSYAVPVETAPSPNLPQADQAPLSQSPPNQINFEDLFEQQDVGLATKDCHGKSGCQTCSRSSHVRECAVMPYHLPKLPAPATLHGYFNASPCTSDVWDGYSCEAAAECAKQRQSLRGMHSHSNACACGKAHCE